MKFVSEVDKVLVVPAANSLPNKENLSFKLEANKPVKVGDGKGEIPFEVAKSYSESYRYYHLLEDGEAAPVATKPGTEAPKEPVTQFDALGWIEKNAATATQTELLQLEVNELKEVCIALELKPHPNAKKETIAAQAAQEIKIRNEANSNADLSKE